MRVRVRLVLGVLIGLHAARPQVGAGRLVHCDDAGLAAGLDRHVGEREAPLHVERVDVVPDPLHRHVVRAVGPDAPDHFEHDVFGGHAGLRLAGHPDQHGLGHLEPDLARVDRPREVGAAHARGKGPERPRVAGVRVARHQRLPRLHQAGVFQHHVRDAAAPHVVEVPDALFLHPALELLVHLGGLDVHRRHRVVGDRHDLVRVEHPVHPAFLEHPQRGGGGDLVAQHPVGRALDQLARHHLGVPTVGRQDFFRNRHSHVAPIVPRLNHARALSCSVSIAPSR